jgi:type VI secretion system Hcp family effector
MVLSRLLGCSVLAVVLVVGGLIASGHAAGVDIVACFGGAVPSDPQSCSSPSVRLDIVSIKSELTNTGTVGPPGGGGGAGKAQFAPFAIVKPLDKTSPKLFLAAATGVHTPTLGIGIFDTAGQKAQRVFSITLTDVVITRIADTAQETTSSTTLASMETVEFDFNQIELFDEVSRERVCFNLTTNATCPTSP